MSFSLRIRSCLVLLVWLLGTQAALAGGKDDPLLTMFRFDQLEIQDADGGDDPLVIASQAWAGYDLHKLWFKFDAEWADGDTEEAELQALYSKAISPNWDLQLGVRKDFQPSPSRTWAVVGLQGLAPYFFELEPALFIGESGRTGVRLEGEYELLLTQRLILTPEAEVNFYGQNDEATGTGSGLSNAEVELRLRYEFHRQFAPYIGVSWSKSFGNTADFARQAGEESSDTRFVLGLRAWF